MSVYREIVENGLWKQNPGLVQLLGLCPTLAVTSTVVNGVSLGLATALVMAGASGAVAAVRNFVPAEIRIPVFILIIAVLVTVIQLTMNAYMLGLYQVLGIFVPLIVVNCIVLGRAEAFASRNPVPASMLDGFVMGLGLTFALALLGGLREIAGRGTLFSGLDLALGDWAKDWVIHVIPGYPGFLVAMLPPGAFIGLGLLIAGHNWVTRRRARVAPRPAAAGAEA